MRTFWVSGFRMSLEWNMSFVWHHVLIVYNYPTTRMHFAASLCHARATLHKKGYIECNSLPQSILVLVVLMTSSCKCPIMETTGEQHARKRAIWLVCRTKHIDKLISSRLFVGLPLRVRFAVGFCLTNGYHWRAGVRICSNIGWWNKTRTSIAHAKTQVTGYYKGLYGILLR